MRALSSEGVISVGASVILASQGAGPPEVVKTLKTTTVPYVEVSDNNSADGIVGKVRLIAKVVGADVEGEKLAQKVRDDFKVLAETRARILAEAGEGPFRSGRAERSCNGRRPEHQRGCHPHVRRRHKRGG